MIPFKAGPSRLRTKALRRLPLILLLAFSLFACSVPGRIDRRAVNPYWNDLAHFLAGMPLGPGSPFTGAASSETYRRHIETMNKFWVKVQAENIDLIVPWRDSHIPGRYEKNAAFYPFSGADFVNLYTLFPRAASYTMVALEEPGPIPEPLKLTQGQLASGLSSIHRAIWTIASENYFKSGIMQQEMTNRHLQGTTPVLLIFAARLGLTVSFVEPVGLDPGGNITPLDSAGKIGGRKPEVYGTRIGFTAPGGKRPRELVYLRMRLSNGVMSQKSGEGRFFKNMNRLNVMIKSAVYLLHRESFRDVCSYLLDRSDVIIQDDSGIPFRYFDRSKWNISLFGAYTYPRSLKDLPNPPHQPDLTKEYSYGSAVLPFNFGYGVLTGKGKSNLLCAVNSKKKR